MNERINLLGPRYRAEQLPYGYFVKPPDGDRERGVIWLRPGGLLIGWKVSGPPFESTSAADVAAVCGQFGASFGLMETGDCLRYVSIASKRRITRSGTFRLKARA
jgi:hypothetical protein